MAINYIRIDNPWFLEQDNEGRPAAGYLVYTLVAGSVDTLLTTYSDRTLLVPNTNPVVLNNRGQARIFTSVPVKLVYCAPGGDLTSPIWTEDYVGEAQDAVSDKVAADLGTEDNNYTASTVPPYLSIPDGFSLVLIPDVDSLSTMEYPTKAVAQQFNGTGVNDLEWLGPYIGADVGAVFVVEITGVAQPAAPTLAENMTAGFVTAGNHSVKIAAVTATGVSLPSAASNVVAAAGSRQLDVTGIPAIAGLILSYNIYMNKAGGTTWYYVGNTNTTSFTINVQDALLGTGVYAAAPTAGTASDVVRWRKDGDPWHENIVIDATEQVMQDNLRFKFSRLVDHTIGDQWSLTVMTPATLNFCGLGAKIIYKNVDGVLVALDEKDMVATYPAHLDWSETGDAWILLNPSLPVLESLIPNRVRKSIYSDYTVLPADYGMELDFIGATTVTLPDAPEATSLFFYLRNSSTSYITIDAGSYLIKWANGYSATTMMLGPGAVVQVSTDGGDWHVLTSLGYPMLLSYQDANAASVTFSNLMPGFKYRLVWEVASSNSATLFVRINNDAGGNYHGAAFFALATGGNNGMPFPTYFYCCESDADDLSHGEFDFGTVYGDNTKVKVYGRAHSYYTGNRLTILSGVYLGAADLSSLVFATTVGILTGRLWLYLVE